MSDEKERYFFVSFYCRNAYKSGIGNLDIISKKFPSSKLLREKVAKSLEFELKDVTVINIFEFRDKIDYDNFCRED